MNAAALALRHSRAAALMAVALVIGGVLAAFALPSGIYPPLQFPRIVIVAHSGTLPPPSMSLIVTRPIEQVVMAVPGPEVEQLVPGLPQWKRDAIARVPTDASLILNATNVVVMVVDYKPMALFDVALIAAAALAMGLGQFAIVRALRLAPAAAVAPVQYTMMPWAIAYGVLLFDKVVHPLVLVGAAIVIASSLYTLHREHYRGRTLSAHVPTGFARAGMKPPGQGAPAA